MKPLEADPNREPFDLKRLRWEKPERPRLNTECLKPAARFCGWWTAWGIAGAFVTSMLVPFFGSGLLIAVVLAWVAGLIAAAGYVAGTRWRGQTWGTIAGEVVTAALIGLGLLVGFILLGGYRVG